jgi:hypothetical protein
MEGTVKSYIKMVDTVNENSDSFDEAELIGKLICIQSVCGDFELDISARLARIKQSKPFQANIPANTACLFCRRRSCDCRVDADSNTRATGRKIKCDGSLPQCDMCAKHRQAKCEYPQKSHYGGFSNRGGLHYVVPMGPDIAAAAASSVPGASPPVHLDPGKAVKGYAPPAPTAAPTYILPGPPPPGSTASGSMYGGSQRPTEAPTPMPRRDSYASSTGAPYERQPHQGYSSRHDTNGDGPREKRWDDEEEEDDARPVSSTSSQLLQNRHAAHLARKYMHASTDEPNGLTHVENLPPGNGNQDGEMEDANEVPRRRSPHTGKNKARGGCVV